MVGGEWFLNHRRNHGIGCSQFDAAAVALYAFRTLVIRPEVKA